MISYYPRFLNKFQDLKEVREALVKHEPQEFNSIIDTYASLIKMIASYSDYDRKIINSVYTSLDRHNAAGGGKELSSLEFLDSIGAKGVKLLTNAAKAIKSESGIVDLALSDLHNMVAKGYGLAREKKKFSNGDAESDAAIWTQTQFSDPIRIIHIISAHFVERFVCRFMLENNITHPFDKDALLNAMDDPILLIGMKRDNNYSVYQIWTNSKESGGLDYINPKKIERFRNIIHHSISTSK